MGRDEDFLGKESLLNQEIETCFIKMTMDI